MKNYCLNISYDGTNYSGWQFQPNRRTIQSELETALKIIFPDHEIKLIGSGRTDSKVHALNQVANVLLDVDFPIDKFKMALNGNLPNDIYINNCTLENNNFHARFSAKKREYIYYISNTFSPMNRLYSWNINWEIDLASLHECSKMIIGKHDFSSFSKASSEAKDRTCEIFISDWSLNDDGHVFNIIANRFLHHMVRFLVGTMIEVGRGRYSKNNFEEMLYSRNKNCIALCAPPQGLFLKNVYY